jgi:3-carboxy-cis,cis-muconate cycloisomerase
MVERGEMDAGPIRRFTDGRVPDSGIAQLFSSSSRLRARLRVEAALAQAEAAAEVIPPEASDAITDAARIERLDLDRIERGTVEHSHPLMPLIDELSRVTGEHGGWVHWGATTQNITQTADLLLIRRAHTRILEMLADLLRELSKLAEDSAAVPMAGRTHSQHAVPITFGFKVAIWIDALASHVDRLEHLEDRLFRLLMGGAAGTLASFGEEGREIEAGVAERLGLSTMPVPSRATNDGMVELVTVLGLFAGTAGKVAKDIYSMMQPEFGEAFEPIPAGTIGSSTMPHKRNPQLALDVMTASAQLRGLVAPALEAMLHDHEANGAMTGLLEETVAQAATLAGDILSRLVAIFDGLRFDPDRMEENLELSAGLIGSESLMLRLGERIGRQRAHEVVYELAQSAGESGGDFATMLLRDPDVSETFTEAEIRQLIDPRTHLGESAVIARAMAEHARAVADRIQLDRR